VKDLRLLDRPLERGQNVNDCVLMTQFWPLLNILLNESAFRVALLHRMKSGDDRDLFPAMLLGPIETEAAVPCLSGA
jgi:hypothetical protein